MTSELGVVRATCVTDPTPGFYYRFVTILNISSPSPVKNKLRKIGGKHETNSVFDMYRDPYADAGGIGGSKQTSDEVGKEDGECPRRIGKGRRPSDDSRRANEDIAKLFG